MLGRLYTCYTVAWEESSKQIAVGDSGVASQLMNDLEQEELDDKRSKGENVNETHSGGGGDDNDDDDDDAGVGGGGSRRRDQELGDPDPTARSKHWIDLAEGISGVTEADVRSAKSLYRIAPVLSMLCAFWMLFDQQGSAWVLQVSWHPSFLCVLFSPVCSLSVIDV